MHALYRFYDEDGGLLYIGITNNIWNRFKDHGKTQDWWYLVATATIEHCRDRQALERAEKVAIYQENPRFNIVHNRQERPDPIFELLNKVAYLEAKIERLAPYAHRPRVDGATEFPAFLSKSQFLDATGLTDAKFKLLKKLGLLPADERCPNGRWLFERSAAVEFALSDVCEIARINTVEDATCILSREVSLRKAEELREAIGTNGELIETGVR